MSRLWGVFGALGRLVAGVVELVSHASGVVVAALFLVQRKGFPPHGMGLLVLVEYGVGVAEVVEGVGGFVGVAEAAEQGESVGIGADSDFGPITEQAVRNAQTRINQDWDPDVLRVDGRFGPITSSYFRFQLYDHSNGGAHTGLCTRR